MATTDFNSNNPHIYGGAAKYSTLASLLAAEAGIPDGTVTTFTPSSGNKWSSVKNSGQWAHHPVRDRYVATSLIVEDASYGYSVVTGADGISRDVDNNLVLTADTTNTTVEVQLPILGVKNLWKSLDLKIACAVSNPYSNGATVNDSYLSSRIGVRHHATGAVAGQFVESIAWYNGAANWLLTAHQTNAVAHSGASGGAVAPANMQRLGLNIRLDQGGSSAYPSFDGLLDETWDATVAATASGWMSYSGYDLVSNSNQTGYWSIYVDVGASPGAGCSVALTIKGFVASLQVGKY